jgi:Flp pilus assembly pilin Flp
MAKLRDWLYQLRARLPSRERGQGLMEYGLIISVVSIAAVVLIMAMGPRVASMFSSAGASAFPSDRRRKGGFAAVDREEILAQAVTLPVAIWTSARQDPAVRHIGPRAEHFRAAFELGDGTEGIAAVDANGIALTAIQGLHARVQGQKTQIAELADRLAALDASRATSEPEPAVT